jgi:hypothetical protein
MIQHTETQQTLHPGQYGGRSGRNAKILVFLEEIKTEISYATCKSLINFDNDVASCYDRIIPALASLIGRKYGMHRNVIFVDTLVTIPAKSAYETHKTLGHHKAPTGKNLTQLRIHQANSNIFSKLVATSSCNRTNAWFFYSAIYLKSIGYVLPNCFYDEQELLKVQKSALRAFLAKCGYNRNTQRTIVFAPIRFGGCGSFPLLLIQGEEQIVFGTLAHSYYSE